MIIIISGLPGTGKTTLCNELKYRHKFDYVSDWDIFYKNNIKIEPFENKNEISQKYSSVIIDYIISNKDKNLVLDLEYSISPNDFMNSEISKYTKIIYLGFVGLPLEMLYKLFSKSSANKNVSREDLMKRLEYYKDMSLDYQEQCLKHNLEFVDVILDRDVTIENIINNLDV